MRQDRSSVSEHDAGLFEDAQHSPVSSRQQALDAGATPDDALGPLSVVPSSDGYEERTALWRAVGELWRWVERHYGMPDPNDPLAFPDMVARDEQERGCVA